MTLLIFFRFFSENMTISNLDRKISSMSNLDNKFICVFFSKKYAMSNLDRKNISMGNLDKNNKYMRNLVRK